MPRGLETSPFVVWLPSSPRNAPLSNAALLSLHGRHLPFGFQLCSLGRMGRYLQGGSLWATPALGLCYSSALKAPTSSCLGTRTVQDRSDSARLKMLHSSLHCVPSAWDSVRPLSPSVLVTPGQTASPGR